MRTAGHEDERVERAAGRPRIGPAVTALGLVAMVALARTAWPDLPAVIDNDESGVGPHGGSTPRGLLVASMPLVLAGTAALFLVLLSLAERVRPHLPAAVRGTARGARAAVDTVMSVLALLLTPLHALVVLNAAGADLPVGLVVGLAVGTVLVLLGLVYPRIVRLQSSAKGIGAMLARTARPTGVAVAGVGVVQIATVLLTDDVLVATLPPVLLAPAMLGAFVWPFLRHGLRLRAAEQRAGR